MTGQNKVRREQRGKIRKKNGIYLFIKLNKQMVLVLEQRKGKAEE